MPSDPIIEPAADAPHVRGSDELHALFAAHIADSGTSWSVGTFGAIAEFHRDADEPVEVRNEGSTFSAVTARGGLRLLLTPGLRAFAYETLSSTPGQWNHAVALCLPTAAATMSRRELLTELGADIAAVRAHDRDAVLFDMGLGCRQIDVCLRTADPKTLSALRRGVGRSLLEDGNPLMADMPRLSPHRVFSCPFGRVEVYQPVPAPDGISPMGPHTHVLPKLMREERTHAATTPIPEGWIPCAHLYPVLPTRTALGHAQPLDAEAHRRFQDVLRRFGDPALWRLKCRVLDHLERGELPEPAAADLSRHERATVRIALRQWQAAGLTSPALAAWTAAFDTTGVDQTTTLGH